MPLTKTIATKALLLKVTAVLKVLFLAMMRVKGTCVGQTPIMVRIKVYDMSARYTNLEFDPKVNHVQRISQSLVVVICFALISLSS